MEDLNRGRPPKPPELRKRHKTFRCSPATITQMRLLAKALSKKTNRDVYETIAFEGSIAYCLRAIRSGELDPEELLAASK